eukprot:TRINITY_DN15866_c0_g2_i2.p1 TRINITY_DN15866_c0_g2~~TRINITY_DN15866_c0_g2_i2.p1  ORF type:complete len:121 (-),score=12.59 TRINITY_DN15866_c0_g2_i2:340-702(-)
MTSIEEKKGTRCTKEIEDYFTDASRSSSSVPLWLRLASNTKVQQRKGKEEREINKIKTKQNKQIMPLILIKSSAATTALGGYKIHEKELASTQTQNFVIRTTMMILSVSRNRKTGFICVN